ncbi:MAG: hypothetical protein QOJ19_1268, partial [Acidimicrobiia bacterium]|nr:hypothetical protein [Acidimicrobiia bacterium]
MTRATATIVFADAVAEPGDDAT